MFLNTDFKSLADFLDFFNNEAACERYFEQIRFKNGEFCPHCNHDKIHRFTRSKRSEKAKYAVQRFRCGKCKRDFTLKTNTIFGESKVTLRQWFIAIYLLTTSKKGISSIQLSKFVGVTQKTGWFIDHRLRTAMRQDKKQLSGEVEADETYIGGREKNKHFSKRQKGTQGRNTKTKTPVVGFLQRSGKLKAMVVDDVRRRTLERLILENIKANTALFTDEFKGYKRIGQSYKHQTVIHSKGQYVKGRAHTNGIESFWALFKRGYMGTYHKMSKKHLQRYIDEFVYRFNQREQQIDRAFADAVQSAINNDKLGYKELIQAL